MMIVTVFDDHLVCKTLLLPKLSYLVIVTQGDVSV
jgi:hypothetical protein